MAITVLPPIAFTPEERSDLATLSSLIVVLASVLDGEARIASVDRTMTADTITSINVTITDASDRIDAIVNPEPAV